VHGTDHSPSTTARKVRDRDHCGILTVAHSDCKPREQASPIQALDERERDLVGAAPVRSAADVKDAKLGAGDHGALFSPL
jgi:hypothetical protein